MKGEAGTLAFSYHRGLSPMIGVLLGIAICETFVVHIVVMAIWGWRPAVVLALLDLSAIVWLILLLRSFRRLPVMLDGDMLILRAGTLKSITLGVDDIVGLRHEWDAAAIKRRDMLNLALIAWPNLVIDLKTPIHAGWRTVAAIAHRLDEPEAFRAALDSVRLSRLPDP